MADSYFVFGVLAMLAMVLGARPRWRPGGGDEQGLSAPQPPAPPKPAPRRSPGNGKGKRRKK